MKRTDDEGKPDENERERDSKFRVSHREGKARTDPPRVGVEARERDSRDRRGERERKIDHRVENASTWKANAHERPRDYQSEERVHARCEKRRAKRQEERFLH